MNVREVCQNLTNQVVYIKDASDEHTLGIYRIPHLKSELSTPYDDFLVTLVSKEKNNTIIYVLADD